MATHIKNYVDKNLKKKKKRNEYENFRTQPI